MRHEVLDMGGFLGLRIGDVVGGGAGGGELGVASGGVVGSEIYGAVPGGWYALRVAAQREDQAEAWLQRRGVYGFHPVMVRRVRRFGKQRAYARRYLPGYVFARFPGEPVVHRVLACPFITGAVVLSSGDWARIAPAGLRALHAMRRVDEASEAARRAAVKARRQAAALRPGDAALFRDGPLAGTRCEVVSVRGPGDVSVALTLFGREVSARAVATDLVAVRKSV